MITENYIYRFPPTQSRYFDCDDDDDDTFSNNSDVIEGEYIDNRQQLEGANEEALFYCNGNEGYCCSYEDVTNGSLENVGREYE